MAQSSTATAGGVFAPTQDLNFTGTVDVVALQCSTTVANSGNAAAGIGYASGAGGTVTQATNKSTAVTLNAFSGQITMNGAALNTVTSVQFTLTNNCIQAGDVVIVNLKSGNTAGSYFVSVDAIAANSVTISLRNYSGGSLSEAVVLSFVVIGGATT